MKRLSISATVLLGLALGTIVAGPMGRAWGKAGANGTRQSGTEKAYMLVSVGAGDENPLLNRTVLGLKGQRLGTIDTLIIDVKEGKIAYLVVSLESGRLIPLPWNAFTFPTGGGSVVLNATEEQLEKTMIDADVENILGQ